MDLFSIGQINPGDAGFRTFDHEAEGRCFRFVFRENRLVGAILLGDTRLTAAVKKAVENGTDCSRLLATCGTATELAETFGVRINVVGTRP